MLKRFPVFGSHEWRELELSLARKQGLTSLPQRQRDQLRELARRKLPKATEGKSRTKSANHRVFKVRGEAYQYSKVYICRVSGSGKPVDRDGKRRSR